MFGMGMGIGTGRDGFCMAFGSGCMAMLFWRY